MSLMVGDAGKSVGVEHIPELTAKAVENVQKSNAARLLNIGSLSLHTGGNLALLINFVRNQRSIS